MDKNKLRNFAIAARVELIRRVSDRAALYDLTETTWTRYAGRPSRDYRNLSGEALSPAEASQRDALLRALGERGFAQVMEEAAYTWFNRLIALRYMQDHDLLPVRARVLPEAPGYVPELVREAQHVQLEGVDPLQVLEMMEQNRTDALYKLLLIRLCNQLHDALPLMFEPIEDYTEMLFPDGLLRSDSVLAQMAQLGDENWKDIEVIGWLYQYYNTQLKDETFELLRKNVKITKERIGAATQLFTPEWIVRYMVENSVGRLWLEGHPDAALREKWRYYLDEAEQEPQVAQQLLVLRRDAANLRPEEITVLDPCMGSGHILVAAFDVLMDIYRSVGYTDRDAARSIVEHNLYGLDIDNRAAQLAYFAVMMKACEVDGRFLRRGVQPHVQAIQERAKIPNRAWETFGPEKDIALRVYDTFMDAKEYGSLIEPNVTLVELDALAAHLEEMRAVSDHDGLEAQALIGIVINTMFPLMRQARILAQKYQVVATNPPYMGVSNASVKVQNYVKGNYPDSKSDLFAVFIERCERLVKQNGYQAMITQHAWMFLSSFEKLRVKLINTRTIINMCHLGARAFEEISGEIVQTVAWIMRGGYYEYAATYVRLVDSMSQKKQMFFFEGDNRYISLQKNYTAIPGTPVAYWISTSFQRVFEDGEQITKYVSSRDGLTTGNNDLFIKQFWEVSYSSIEFGCKNAEEFWMSQKRFAPLIKGGLYRKWYGNNWFVITYDGKGYETLANCGNKLPSRDVYFYPYITWNRISTRMAFRYCEEGYLFESASLVAFSNSIDSLMYALAFTNSIVAKSEMELINPTTNMLSGYVDALRVPRHAAHSRTIDLANECVNYAKEDWDSYETSWDFKKHPLV